MHLVKCDVCGKIEKARLANKFYVTPNGWWEFWQKDNRWPIVATACSGPCYRGLLKRDLEGLYRAKKVDEKARRQYNLNQRLQTIKEVHERRQRSKRENSSESAKT
jgi:hypothetical protein